MLFLKFYFICHSCLFSPQRDLYYRIKSKREKKKLSINELTRRFTETQQIAGLFVYLLTWPL